MKSQDMEKAVAIQPLSERRDAKIMIQAEKVPAQSSSETKDGGCDKELSQTL